MPESTISPQSGTGYWICNNAKYLFHVLRINISPCINLSALGFLIGVNPLQKLQNPQKTKYKTI
jgi:hypothetical protein